MANATFEDHPTDPNKVILRKKPYLDKGADYEHGFVDGMQHQMQSSVDKAVNGMTRTWVGLTSVDWNDFNAVKSNDPQYVAQWAEAKLKEKNT